MLFIFSDHFAGTLDEQDKKIWENPQLIQTILSPQKIPQYKFPSTTTFLRIDHVSLKWGIFKLTITPCCNSSKDIVPCSNSTELHLPMNSIKELASSLTSSQENSPPSSQNSETKSSEYKSAFNPSIESLLKEANEAALKVKILDECCHLPKSIENALIAITKPQDGKLTPKACLDHYKKNPKDLERDCAVLGFYLHHLWKLNDRENASAIAALMANEHPTNNEKAIGYYTLGKINLYYGSFQEAHNNFAKCLNLTSDKKISDQAKDKQDYCQKKLTSITLTNTK